VTRPLFEFNTSVVEAFSGDLMLQHLTQAQDAVEHEIRESLRKQAPDEEFDIYWEDDQIVVGLTAEQAQREFGEPGTPLTATVRTALAGAAERLRPKLAIRE
jgi:hypothetical protein